MAKYVAKHLAKKRKTHWIWLILLLVLLASAAAAYFLIPYVQDLLYIETFEELTIEAGEPVPPAQEYLAEDADIVLSYVSDISSIQTNVPGDHSLTILCKDEQRTVTLHIEDTIAPAGTVQNLSALQSEIPSAEDFVTSAEDVSGVTISFAKAPDPDQAGEQEVVILLTDAAGNETELTAVLDLTIDHEAPVIEGVQHIAVYQGTAVAYRSGVSVTDDQDGAPSLTIDSSGVDLSKPGVYEVTYTASDFAGNTSSVTATITVYEKKESYVDMETIYAAVDDILARIVNDSMNDREKIEKVFWWIRQNTAYVNSSVKDDWMQAGYQMLKTRRGDCFSYFALNKLMLERLGIPNIDVEKIPNYQGDSRHYWSLVSADGGETYYHVDITPRTDMTIFLMVTDSFLDNYSQKHYNCYNRDTSLYPATPEE